MLQQPLLDVWLGLAKLQEPARFRAWLLQIARRPCLDVLARRRPQPIDPAAIKLWLDRAGHRVAERGALFCDVRGALDQAPPTARQAAELFYLQGLSINPIALRLGKPIGTVKRRLPEARSFLRRRLGV